MSFTWNMRSWEKFKMSPKGKAIDLNWNLLLNWKSSRLALSHTTAVSTNYYQEYFLQYGNVTSPSMAFSWFLCLKNTVTYINRKRCKKKRRQHYFGPWKSPCAHSVTLNCKRKSRPPKFVELNCSPLRFGWGNPPPSPAKFPDIRSRAFGP